MRVGTDGLLLAANDAARGLLKAGGRKEIEAIRGRRHPGQIVGVANRASECRGLDSHGSAQGHDRRLPSVQSFRGDA